MARKLRPDELHLGETGDAFALPLEAEIFLRHLREAQDEFWRQLLLPAPEREVPPESFEP